MSTNVREPSEGHGHGYGRLRGRRGLLRAVLATSGVLCSLGARGPLGGGEGNVSTAAGTRPTRRPARRRARRTAPALMGGVLAVTTIAAMIVAMLLGSPAPRASAASLQVAFSQEPFTGANVQVPSEWVMPAAPDQTTQTNYACLTASSASQSPSQPIPGCGGSPLPPAGTGLLQMTSATGNEEGGVASTYSVPSSQGIDVHFDTYQYGGTGADGIMFFLQAANPSNPQPQALGAPGGALAYANSSGSSGMVNGYLGIGFDVFGNYDNTDVGGSTCTVPSYEGNNKTMANEVSVRGPGSGNNGYCMLSSTAANGGLQGNLDGGLGGTPADSQVPAEVAINPTATAFTTASGLSVPAYSYVVSVTPIGASTQILSGSLPADAYLPAADSSWLDSNGIPRQLIFGFAASTGGSTDFHQVNNVQVSPLGSNPPQFGLTLGDSAAGVLLQGASVTYTATPSLSSTTGSEGNPPTFVATFPSGVTPGNATGTNWACTTSAPTVTCDYSGTGAISPGTTLPQISIPATVAASASGAQVVGGTLWENNAIVARADDTGTAVSAAQATPALGLTFADSAAGQLAQDAAVTYTASGTVSSSGASETKAPSFTATLPAAETLGSATGTNWSCSNSGQTLTCNWTGGTVAPGTALDPISIPVTVSADATGAQPVTGTLSSADASPASVSVTDYATVVSTPTLALTTSDNASGILMQGASVTYTLAPSVVSPGWNEADTPVVTDNFPPVFSSVTPSSANTDWPCAQSTSPSAITETCTYTGSTPIVAGTTLPSIVFDNVVSSSASTGTSANDSASISSNDAPTAIATDYARIGEGPAPNLSVTASAPSSEAPGTTYSLGIDPALQSSGGSASSDPVVTSTLPSGETFSSAPTPSNWGCALSGSSTVDTCTYSGTTPIPAGTSLTPINAAVVAGSAGIFTTQITMTDATDGAAEVSTSVTSNVAVPVLAISESVPASVLAGSSYTDTVSPSISSTGGPADHAPTVTSTLPSGETYSAAGSGTGWTCALSSTNTVDTCTYSGSLPIAAGTTLGTISATVDV
ncbi:MAG: hypothetical protein M0035_08425, partial [Actinomycetota bacterium]|nr:hypothetical protein [Actinomycetota bacterium]